MSTNFSILSCCFVFRYRLCPTYSYSFIIILLSDITSPTTYSNIILSIIIVVIIIWSVITAITSTTIITNIVHVICIVTITIFNWDSKYNNIGSFTFRFFISPICANSNCKIIYPTTLPTGIPFQSTSVEAKPSKVGLC